MSADLHARRVLVVGGETAIGRVVAVGLAEAGADVAIASLSQDTKAEFAINSTLNELWALGRQGVALLIDASDAEELREAMHRAERELGRIDAAVTVSAANVAVDALRDALGDRPVIELTAEVLAEDAPRIVMERLA